MDFNELNKLGSRHEPFLFICDYKAQNLKIILLSQLKEHDVEFSIDSSFINHRHKIKKNPILFDEYKQKFNLVQEKIKSGDTYLLNLTAPSKIEINLSLKEIFKDANATYKLRYKDKFVCFSPESFVKIKDNEIHTYPMKGTIDASIKGAEEKILSDKKEMAEHVMVVDLLRNDLSMVAKNVKVNRFRYVEQIFAGSKKLLHVSSHICGDIGEDWHGKIGNILKKLLPAGSISGTPKRSTLDIIEFVENYERGFFSGVFGIYDGKTLDSAVMIRFIEKTKEGGYIYKSGGGITLDSDILSEYNELLDKVYIP